MSDKRLSKASIIVSIVTFVLGLILTPIIVKAVTKQKSETPKQTELTGKILEGEFIFDESVSDVKIKSGYLYSTEEVLLIEIHVENYGIAKLTFRKSEEPDIRGAYRYDVIAEESERLSTDNGDPVTVTAEILVTTTDESSYRVYSKTYTTASEWTNFY